MDTLKPAGVSSSRQAGVPDGRTWRPPSFHAKHGSMPLTDQQRADFDRLVRSHDVVLFMKGSRRFPQCGFSATVVGILDKLVSGYQTVNILSDPGVREGMKEFSSWPTFPQLYVRGKFVGGCDIVKEMHASGELQRLLGASASAPPARAPDDTATPVAAPRVTITAAAARAFAAAAPGGGDVLHLEIDPDFNCDLHFAPAAASDVETRSGDVVLYVEGASVARADGVVIDYVEAPGGMAFKIDNPNAPPRVRRLTPKALKAMLDRGEVQLFDVRPESERARASIAQATSLDADGQRLLFGLSKETPIALHCHHGVRSRAAAEQLLREGFTNVYNLEGGIEAWSREVDPSVPRY
jgi:monothiol glutaredoxin